MSFKVEFQPGDTYIYPLHNALANGILVRDFNGTWNPVSGVSFTMDDESVEYAITRNFDRMVVRRGRPVVDYKYNL